MPSADAEAEVLIVGGGPVGLTARALLERWGVRVLLVEKRRELSPFPRSRLVNVRSMEIYRQLGLAAGIAGNAFAPEYGRVRFRDTLHDRDFATAAMIGVNAPVPESPVTGVVTSQDRLEPTLLAAADAHVRFGVELVGLAEENDGVLASLVDHRRGDRTRVRARYVLAADGANSTVRQLLGIGTTGPGAMGDFTTVVFDADLNRWCARQPAGVYFTSHGSFAPLYPEGGWAWFGPTPVDAAGADWPGLVSRALGPGADVQAEVVRVQHWVMNAFVAERFRHSRILLAGDAAHAVPIIGGLGMNTGLADVHNLCWKLAGALQGWAEPSLVGTYETERQPVAHETLRQAVANARLLLQVQNRRRDQLQTGQAASARIELPWSERYFAQLGLVLGVTYRSGAVLTDNSAPPEPSDTGTDYIPTTAPGRRMPHLWLSPDRSTLDAFGAWFTLLTPDPAHWAPRTTAPWPLRIEPLPDEHTDLCDLGPHGALLIRPDGHIGARWRDHPPGEAALHHALSALTRPALKD
ncbi:2-polyprenyl-6-methoxyphenol hydroxylase [Streptomyces cellostaticus]|uniref:2-polyprenyl-6-methoxyphenol hydroxylase n=1 Tax=Streptomyces cellostaticus TaxID=67285 RepID=A0A117PXH7_9ACTN|nr:FAD-dependent monooxygenase [Streptomyces cellostaticus]KUM97445.1 2-polyprenyl-6-methoxyphenol hydroxylase [Streptomyces cellostaticus]GHI04083.1 FAD-dependent oxidoreductase [Streptomyces cellostaticus]